MSFAEQKLAEKERAALAEKLDENLDDELADFVTKLLVKNGGENQESFDFDKLCTNVDQHPAFAKNVKFDIKTENAATKARQEGNKHFERKNYLQALRSYSDAIKIKCSNSEINAVCYSNRAAANVHLKNFAAATRDAMYAVRFNPAYLKAALRGAECLLELGLAQRCIDWYKWHSKRLYESGATFSGTDYNDFHEKMEILVCKANHRLESEKREQKSQKAKKTCTPQPTSSSSAPPKKKLLEAQPRPSSSKPSAGLNQSTSSNSAPSKMKPAEAKPGTSSNDPYAEIKEYMHKTDCCGKKYQQCVPFEPEKLRKALEQRHPALIKPPNLGYIDDKDAKATENAMRAREEGNKHFNRKEYRLALDAYTKGIDEKCSDAGLNSKLYGNRSAALRHLGNSTSALMDCVFAVCFDLGNFKAVLRAVECLLETGQPNHCIEWDQWYRHRILEDGISFDDAEFAKFNEQMDALMVKVKQCLGVKESVERKRTPEEKKSDQEKRALLAAFKERNLRFKPPINSSNPEDFRLDDLCARSPFTQEKLPERVHLGNGNLVWPVLLVFAGTLHTEMLKDVSESTMIGEAFYLALEKPPSWDTKPPEFTLNNLMFFLPLDVPDDRQLEMLCLNQTLRDILSTKDHVINGGLPVIQVYTKQKIKTGLEKISEKRYRIR